MRLKSHLVTGRALLVGVGVMCGLGAVTGACSAEPPEAPPATRPAASGARWPIQLNSARVSLPERATDGFGLREDRSGVALRVRLSGARPVAGERSETGLRFRGADRGGGDVEVTLVHDGLEDWIHLDQAPGGPVRYELELEGEAAGLRLVGGVLEVLDAQGAPRLRAAVPYLIDARGQRHGASYRVNGCAVDQDPSAPWGRPVVAPGGQRCELEVDWKQDEVAYPARLDPTWQLTSNMSVARSEAATVTLSNGVILVVGGRPSPGEIHTSAELYNPTSGTWASTGSPQLGYLHNALRLNDGRVLVVNGLAGPTLDNCTDQAELYSPTLGTWSLTSPMTTKRRVPPTALLPDGSPIAVGNAGSEASAEVLDLTKGVWVATPPIPSPDFEWSQAVLLAGIPQRLLVAGGTNEISLLFEQGSLADGQWSITPLATSGHHRGKLLALPGGNALLIGGQFPDGGPGKEVAFFNGTDSKWSPFAKLPKPVSRFGALQELDGTILLAGGAPQAGADSPGLRETFNLNLTTKLWTQGPSMNQERHSHALHRLVNGYALAIGGESAGKPTATAELRADLPADIGEPCALATQCTSGYCVDGVCCESACAGPCQACSSDKKGGGAPGTCGFVAAGTDPDGECPLGQQPCGADGYCNGQGQCRGPSVGTVCSPAQCAGNTVVVGVCNGVPGSCPAGATSCGSYICEGDKCRTSCDFIGDCVAGFYCKLPQKQCVPKLGNGQACTAGDQCTSSFCVDGVCCNTACTGQCQACSAALKTSGASGLCGNAKADTDPHETCATSLASTCAQDGLCNGNGSCRLYAAGTPCKAPSCAGTKATAAFCNGTGACIDQPPVDCAPALCDTGACKSSCISDADCTGSGYCNNGQCVPKLGNGQACAAGDQCASNFCVDGVCCESACAGQCETCSAPGALGQCSPRPAATPCGVQQLCQGVSDLYVERCDGNKTCVSVKQTCGLYVCDSNACKTSCASEADCTASAYCDATQHCASTRANGEACSSTEQCASGFCVDGLCCDTSCAAPCQACGLPGLEGTCSQEPAGTVCGLDSCDGGGIIHRTCSVSGTCVETKNSCNGYSCSGATCASSCTVDTDCDSSAYCDGGACKLKQPNSAPCQNGKDCQSGFCVGGVCCNSLCTGSCVACNLASSPGVCAPTAGGTSCGAPASCDSNDSVVSSSCDGLGTCEKTAQSCGLYHCQGGACESSCQSDSDCKSIGRCVGGACVGKTDNGQTCGDSLECASGYCVDGVCCNTACGGVCGVCNLPSSLGTCVATPQGTACGADACNSSDSAVSSSCDGLGTCKEITKDCGTYRCQGGVCGSSCQGDGDCKSIARCLGGVCVPKTVNGQACASSTDCQSGFCVGGVCCNSLCAGSCVACNLPSSLGTCAPTAEGTSCGAPASCDSNDSVVSSSCDGLGTCEKTAQSCGLYHCQGGACESSCQSDSDCKSIGRCVGGACVGKTDNGQTCGSSLECASGFCVDGVCCNTACTGSCVACGLSSSLGTCTPTAEGTSCGAPASCDSNDSVVSSSCDGLGTCKEITKGCGAYLCQDGVCGSSCQGDGDCKSTARCQNGACVGKTASGQACGGSLECASGFCVDGVCCDKACQGQCEACDTKGFEGKCIPVQGKPHGARPTCAAPGDPCLASFCDGVTASKCAGLPGLDVACGKASCSGNVLTRVSACNGQGACKTPETQLCEPYVCQADACKTSCAADADCSGGAICDKGSGKCVVGAQCLDEDTIKNADGTSTECAPYKCAGSNCRASCASSNDCSVGNVCYADGTCGPVAAPNTGGNDEDGGCGCRTTGSTPGGSPLAALALLALVARRRRNSSLPARPASPGPTKTRSEVF